MSVRTWPIQDLALSQKNSKDKSSILPGAWRRKEGKTTGMEVS